MANDNRDVFTDIRYLNGLWPRLYLYGLETGLKQRLLKPILARFFQRIGPQAG